MHERKDIQGMHILDGKWEKILGPDPGSRGIYIETFTKKSRSIRGFYPASVPFGKIYVWILRRRGNLAVIQFGDP